MNVVYSHDMNDMHVNINDNYDMYELHIYDNYDMNVLHNRDMYDTHVYMKSSHT